MRPDPQVGRGDIDVVNVTATAGAVCSSPGAAGRREDVARRRDAAGWWHSPRALEYFSSALPLFTFQS